MAYTLMQAGTSLVRMSADGTLSTLTLPTGVTLDSTKRPRFSVLGRHVFMVNSPSLNLWIDPEGTVRPMVLRPPASQPRLAAGSGTGLTGAYRCKFTYIVRDPDTGALWAESPFSSPSASFTAANQDLAAAGITTSLDSETTGRRLYRTAAGGASYYTWVEIDGNTQTTINDGTTDAALALAAAAGSMGAPNGTFPGSAGLKLIVSWRDRLWACPNDSTDLDSVYFTETNYFYRWPTANQLVAKPAGEDTSGVTGFVPRRDELGILKRNRIGKVIGTSTTNFEYRVVAEGVGCVAPDSVTVIDDVGYFLGADGVYSFGPNGVSRVSRDKAHGWFNTDTYFSRANYSLAVGRWNPQYDLYELLLPAAGGSTLNRWVAYDRRRGIWFGPNKTDSYTPTFAGIVRDSNEIITPVFGSSAGFVYKQDTSVFNDDGTAVDFDVDSKYHSANTPDIDKVWLDLALISKIQSAASNLTITPKVGGLDAAAGTAITADMTLGRQRFRRLGVGRFLQMNFRHNTESRSCELYGLEIPYFERGRR